MVAFAALAPLIAEGVRQIGAITTNAMNTRAQKKINRENFKHDVDMAQYAWNNFNSPLAQKGSLVEAGFNPNLAQGVLNTQAVATSQGAAYQNENPMQELSSTILQYVNEKRALDMQEKQNAADVAKTNAERENVEKDTELKKLDIESYNDRTNASLEVQRKTADKLKQDIELVVPTNVENVKSVTELNEKQIDEITHKINNLIIENRLLDREDRIQAVIYTDEYLHLLASNALSSQELEKSSIALYNTIVTGSSELYEENQRWIEQVKRDIMKGSGDPKDIIRFISLALLSRPLDVVQILGNAVGGTNDIITSWRPKKKK